MIYGFKLRKNLPSLIFLTNFNLMIGMDPNYMLLDKFDR